MHSDLVLRSSDRLRLHLRFLFCFTWIVFLKANHIIWAPDQILRREVYWKEIILLIPIICLGTTPLHYENRKQALRVLSPGLPATLCYM